MPGEKKSKPLTWAMSYEGDVKGSVITICINPQGKGTLSGGNLQVVIEEAQKLSPGRVEIYTENNDDTYYQIWLKNNETLLRSVGGAKSLDQLKKSDPRWKSIYEKYMEFRKGKSNLVGMMKRDVENVLKNHPEWKDNAEAHIIDTAIHVAWLQTQNKIKTDVTFMWHSHELTETIFHAMQFIMNNAELLGWTSINLVHYPYNLKDLHDTQKKSQKAIAQPLAPVQIMQPLRSASPEEPLAGQRNFHPSSVIGQYLQSYINLIHREEGKKGVAEFFGFLMDTQQPQLQPMGQPENSHSFLMDTQQPQPQPMGQPENSHSFIHKRLPVEEMKTASPPPVEEMKTASPPPSPKTNLFASKVTSLRAYSSVCAAAPSSPPARPVVEPQSPTPPLQQPDPVRIEVR